MESCLLTIINNFKDKFSSIKSLSILIIFVSIISVLNENGAVNRDAVLYLRQAYYFSNFLWAEGLQIYPWPFFSLLVGIVHNFFNLGLQQSAHIINLLLFGTTTFFYLKSIQLIYSKKNYIFYGGILLITFIPIMDDYIPMILRDHGFWAGCMSGTYFFLKNRKFKQNFLTSILWQISFFIAFLFRPEAIVFLIFLPLGSYFFNKEEKSQRLFHDYILVIFFIIISLFFLMIFGHEFSLFNNTRLTELVLRPLSFLSQFFLPLPLYSENYFLSELLKDYSSVITLSVLLSILFYKWLTGFGFFHGVLLLYSLKNFKEYNTHIVFLITISFFIVSVNLFNVYVLTNRYWVFHWLLVLIFLTPVYSRLCEKSNIFLKYIFIIIIPLILLLNVLIDSSKNADFEVVTFIKENNLKNVDLSNHDRIHYYLYRDIPKLIVDKDAKKYRYGMDFYEYRLINNNNQIFNQNKLKKKFNKYLLMKIDDK